LGSGQQSNYPPIPKQWHSADGIRPIALNLEVKVPNSGTRLSGILSKPKKFKVA